ncbi:MAG: NAD-dependent deacylase [Balneolaceae bacterium]
MTDKVVVLTGAGMSADSGLATFRDSGGLWEGYDVYEVATPEGWNSDPERVLEFYNLRRKQASEAEPNEGHKALARLEESYDVSIITQNVDDLHERAGSSHVIHLHGELRKVRSVKNENLLYDIGSKSIQIGDTAEDGAQLRPHVVWFGEMVPMIEKAASVIETADILIVIGTSLVVYPAAGLIDYAKTDIEKHIIDPAKPELRSYRNWHHIEERASTGTPELVNKLLSNSSNS